ISNFVADISTFNKSLTHPHYTHHNTHHFSDQLHASHQPFNHQQPHNISTISDSIFEDREEQKEFVAETFKDLNPLTLVPDRTILSDPVSQVVGEQQVFVDKDYHEEATESLPILKPVPVASAITTESVYSVSETDETSATREEVTHERKEEPHGIGFVVETFNSDLVPDSVQERKQDFTKACKDPNKSGLELNCSNVVLSGVNIEISAAMDQQVITNKFFVNNSVRSSELFDVHPLILDPGGNERRVRPLAAILGNGVCVFDPGGDERNFGSPALILINNHGAQSPLQVPWDRGKLGVSKSLFSVKCIFIQWVSAIVAFPARGAASGWPWVPWSSMKMTASVT
ncbi:hypothetical protein A2U01_0017128, partial [Trifolium medium]|nr:hypothetical protein [Trifolium medium]